MSPLPRWDAAALEEAVAGGGTVFVDLQAEWCERCGPQERVAERVAPEFPDITFASVDVGDHPSVATEYRISTLPAMLVFSSGELADILIGFKRAPLLREALRRLAST